MPATPSLPPESCRAFLLVRRGLPLSGALLLALLALVEPVGRGWYLVGAVALVAEAWSTFARGRAYLALRPTLVRRDGRWARAFRPVARWLHAEEAWILSFCAWNNRRVAQAFRARRARRALVLLPHCIQMARCRAAVVQDLGNCFECGKCAVGDLLPATIQGGWESRIANRSHKAYRMAKDYRPDLIVAVSCADRLLKGLTRMPEVPVYAIPLELPHGMCVDTAFEVPRLLAAMAELVEPRGRRDGAGGTQPRVVPLDRSGIA